MRVAVSCVTAWVEKEGSGTGLPPQEASELWPTFLASSHGYTLGSRMILHHHHMEGAPRRFFWRSDVEVAKSHFTPLKKRLLFAGGAQNALQAAPRQNFRKSGRICVVFNEIDLGFHLLDDRHELHLMARTDSRTHDTT